MFHHRKCIFIFQLLLVFTIILTNLSWASQKISTDTKLEYEDGLLSLKVHDYNVYKLLEELSQVTQKSIIFLDPKPRPNTTISAEIEKMSFDDVFRKIAELSSGSFSIVSNHNNSSIEYFFVTKQGFGKQIDSLQEIRNRLLDKEIISPKEMELLMSGVYQSIGLADQQEADLFLLPAYHILFNNFKKYKELIFSILLDVSNKDGLRFAMLEIVNKNWSVEAEKHVYGIFMNIENDVPYLIGKSAQLLAIHGVDVEGEMLFRFQDATTQEQYYYAGALAIMKSNKAPKALQEFLSNHNETLAFDVKSSCIRSLANLEPDSKNTKDILKDMLADSTNNTHTNDSKSLSIQLINALSKSLTSDVYEQLIKVAKDETIATTVRVTAIEQISHSKTIQQKRVSDDMKRMVESVTHSSISGQEKALLIGLIQDSLEKRASQSEIN